MRARATQVWFAGHSGALASGVHVRRHVPALPKLGSAAQSVVGWPARSAHVEVQRALQKPRCASARDPG